MKKLVVLLAGCLIAINLFGYFFENESSCALTPNLCDLGKRGRLGAESIADYRIAMDIQNAANNGAKYLLLAFSGLNRYMSDMETQTQISTGTLSEVIVNLEVSRDYYEELLKLVHKREYNARFVSKLQRFDYPTFARQNRVHPLVFEIVQSYLQKGDVKGFLKHTRDQMDELLVCLYSLEKEPTVAGTWKLNSQFSELMTAGQYSSMIFTAVKNN